MLSELELIGQIFSMLMKDWENLWMLWEGCLWRTRKDWESTETMAYIY